MRSREDIEAYLMRGGQPYEEVAPNTWVVHPSKASLNVVVRLSDDLVIFRTKALELTTVTKQREALFTKLLELNANEMLDGAWGLADGDVVLAATRRLENLDYNEFEGVIDDFSLALSNHYEALAAFRDAPAA